MALSERNLIQLQHHVIKQLEEAQVIRVVVKLDLFRPFQSFLFFIQTLILECLCENLSNWNGVAGNCNELERQLSDKTDFL